MKRNRLVFYMIFALFHIGAFIFTIALGNSSTFLMKMFSWVPYFKWITLLGVVLVCVDFIWYWASIKEMSREKNALAHEVNTLKAKLFDLQEAASHKGETQRPLTPPPIQP